MIPWKPLEDVPSLREAIALSRVRPVVLFKHSTRCSVSRMVKKRLESEWSQVNDQVLPFYIDLLAFRPVSDAIAEETAVRHESPQFILLQNGQVVYAASHESIEIPDSIRNH